MAYLYVHVLTTLRAPEVKKWAGFAPGPIDTAHTAPRFGCMLDARARALAQGKNFAALTPMLPSGQPSTHIVWVDATDDRVLVNTEVGRQKFANVERVTG